MNTADISFILEYLGLPDCKAFRTRLEYWKTFASLEYTMLRQYSMTFHINGERYTPRST